MKPFNKKNDNQFKFHTITKEEAIQIKGGRFRKLRPIEVKDSNGQDGAYKDAVNQG